MSSISGSIKFSGLGSGTDFGSIIEKMKEQQEMPKTRLEYWKADWQKRYDAFEELLTSISTLNSTLKNFNNINKILSKNVTSSTEGVAKATAKADAPEGTADLEVTQLATNAVLTNSTVYKTKESPISPDENTVFSYTYKGKSYEVPVPRGSSAQSMVDQINKQAKNERVNVTANLVKTGDGFVFQMQGTDTGVKNDLIINSATTVPNFSPKTIRSTTTFGKNNSFMGDAFGPDGLKFSYGKAPVPLPEGKTREDYVTDFNIKPTVDNSFQTSHRYKDSKAALEEDLSFTYDGKEYNFDTINDKVIKSNKAYTLGTKAEPITEAITFSYNGKDYNYEPDGKTTLADVQKEMKKVAGKDLTITTVPEIGEDGKTPTGKHFLQIKANKVDIPIHEDPSFYDKSTDPITDEVRFTSPSGKEIVFAPDGVRSLEEIRQAINDDPDLGCKASIKKHEETGKISLVITRNDYAEDGLTLQSGGTNPPTTIGEVVSAINAETPTSGLSAKLVETDTGFTMRVTGKDGVEFKSGEADPPALNPGDPPHAPDAKFNDFETAKRTLQEVVNEINETGGKKGVFASIFKNGDGTVSLELRGNDPTLLTVPDGMFEERGPKNNTWNKRAAEDARYKLNGLDFEFTSSSNELADVIPGLSVTLTGLGKTTLTTTVDTSKVEDNVMSFVEGVNELLAKFQEFTKFDKNKDVSDAVKQTGDKSWETSFASSQIALQKGGTLTGNYGVMLLNSQIKSMVSGLGVGFRLPQTKDDPIDKFYSLSAIGIEMDPDDGSPTFGQLILREPALNDEGEKINKDDNRRTLSDALAEDPMAVAQLLAGGGGVSDMQGVEFKNQLDGVTKPGTYDVKYSVDESGTVGEVVIGGVRALRTDADKNEYSLQSGPGQGMTITINDLTPGDYKGTVRIKQGKVTQLTELMDYQVRNDPVDLGTSAKRGPLQVLKDNYKEIMGNIDKKIEQEEKRISQWEKRMNLKYARLDTLLGQYNMKSQSAAAALAGMPAIE